MDDRVNQRARRAAPDRTARPIRVVLIDRQAVVRAGLRLLLSERAGLAVAGEAGGAEEGLEVVFREEPDLAVIALEQFGDAELERFARALLPSGRTRLLAVSNTDGPEAVLRAVRAGALGIVSRDEPVEVLVEAIASVHAREAWYRRRAVAAILRAFLLANPAPSFDPQAARLSALTKREREIVLLLSEGMKNREIAERLFISEVTVRHHLTSVFEKLGVANRLELLGLAHRAELASRESDDVEGGIDAETSRTA